MPNNQHTQSTHNRLARRSHTAKIQQPLRGVRQDNPAPPSARIASPQPAPPKKGMRPTPKDVYTPRTQKGKEKKRKTVHLTLWVRPVVKAELKRIAEQENLSVSSTGAAFLERALQQNLDTQHGALLETVIKKEIGRGIRSYSSRLALLLARAVYESAQMKRLMIHVLRKLDVNQQQMKAMLDDSSRGARNILLRKTPQLEDVLNEVERWLEEDIQE